MIQAIVKKVRPVVITGLFACAAFQLSGCDDQVDSIVRVHENREAERAKRKAEDEQTPEQAQEQKKVDCFVFQVDSNAREMLARLGESDREKIQSKKVIVKYDTPPNDTLLIGVNYLGTVGGSEGFRVKKQGFETVRHFRTGRILRQCEIFVGGLAP